MAIKLTDSEMNKEVMHKFSAIFIPYTRGEFDKCLRFVKEEWNQMRTTTMYINFESIYNKYKTKLGDQLRSLHPPTITNEDID